MDSFSFADVQQLSNLMMSQKDVDVLRNNDNKEFAPPLTKMKIKNNRQISTKPSRPQNEIWKHSEIKKVKYIEDERIEPEYESNFRQKVGTEDVYLGFSNIDPSSSKCQELMLKVKLPGSFLKEIQMEIDKDILWIQTSIYNLYYHIPYKIDNTKTKSKWIKDKEELHVFMTMIKDFNF